MKHLSLAIGCATIIVTSHTAHAVGPHSPGYLSLGLQHSLENDEMESAFDDFGIKTSSDFLVYGLYAGLAITPNMALELAYNTLGESQASSSFQGVTEILKVQIFSYP